MKEMPALANHDESFQISTKVKIWRPVIMYPPNPLAVRKDGSIDKTKGPFYELWKHEVKALSTKLMTEINTVVDWSKPDEVIDVTPKWFPDKQVVKFSGK